MSMWLTEKLITIFLLIYYDNFLGHGTDNKLITILAFNKKNSFIINLWSHILRHIK
jgi:hypothetical protein